MIEELIDAFSNNNLKKGKKLVKEYYDEIGELVYEMAVTNENFKDSEGNLIGQDLLSFLSLCGHHFDYEDSNGNNALHAAVNNENQEYVTIFSTVPELFLKKNKDGYNPIMLSFTKSNEDIKIIAAMQIREEINDVFKINGEDMTYLTLAIFTSDPRLLAALIVNKNLDYSIHKPYIDEIEWEDDDDDDEARQNILNNYLLAKTADLDEEMENEDSEEYKNAMELLENINNDNTMNLFDVEKSKVGEEDLELDAMNQGLSPLMLAIAQDNDSKAYDLIESGAKINYRNTAGFSPLMLAIFKNNYEMCEYLINHGAFVNITLYNGLTAIRNVFISGNTKIFKLLLDNGVYLNDNDINYFNEYSENIKNKEKEEMLLLLKKYKNPKPKKQIFPYEYKYELGYNETYEGDGYYKVRDVFAEEYGTNMINPYSCISPFGMRPVISIENNDECKYGVAFRAPSEYHKGAKGAVLLDNGNVRCYSIDEDNYEMIFKNENIIQIESTNYDIVGLTSDGRVLLNDNKLDELEVVKTWRNIKKIATGNSSVFAITNNGEFKYALSKIDEFIFKEPLEEAIEQWKKSNFKLVDIAAHYFNLGIVSDSGEVRFLSSTIPKNETYLVNDIKDAIGIAVNNHFVVLRKNKTLLAFGNNDYNQCNIVKWHDIERVQATHFGTIGYATNGEILSTECMYTSNDKIGMLLSPLWPEGFGNLISMGQFVQDAIRLNNGGEK